MPLNFISGSLGPKSNSIQSADETEASKIELQGRNFKRVAHRSPGVTFIPGELTLDAGSGTDISQTRLH